jgi:hypothetical protein
MQRTINRRFNEKAVARFDRTTALAVGDGNSKAEYPALTRGDEGPTPSRPTTFPLSNEVRGAGNTAHLHPDAPVRATGMRLVARS